MLKFFSTQNLTILFLGIFIIVILLTSFHYIQINIESDIKDVLIKNQSLKQIDSVISISRNIGSDLNLFFSKLEVLSLSIQLNGMDSKSLDNSFFEMQNIFPITSLYILDNEGTIKQISAIEDFNSTIKFDKNKIIENKPIIFSQIDLQNNKNNLIMMYPLVDEENLEGQIGVTIPTQTFFNHYLFSLNSESDFLIVTNKDSKIIFHPNEEFLNSSIFSEVPEENEFVKTVQSGITASRIFNIDHVQRIVSGHNIEIKNDIIFTLFLGIPIELITSESESLFSLQQKYMLIFLFIAIITTGIIFFLLKRSIDLEKEIKLKKFAAIGELTSEMAHDLRNPLSVIMSSIQLLKSKETQKIDVVKKKYYDLIDESISVIFNKIHEMMDFVRTKPLNLGNYSVVKILVEVLEKIDVPKTTEIILPLSQVNVLCDKEKITAVFINLINNSLEAMDYQGKISIRINEYKERVLIEIEDSGPGIPYNEIGKIFDPLFSTKSDGTGLGLASCKNIIEQHNGKISVKTNPTVFTIELPKRNI